ncbi:type III secretion system needle length determinant, SpaN/EivJ family [Yersinia kristensenii]|uniref:SpaN/EivJ family type III secretion system needle length determinant n=1 Tax=Yersinia kristensenii TaxID=28152 RepID=UPI0005EA0C51|nr:type III secretion system needle length determinant, SpaN/EivJ family [Yersinia kristensenii]CNF34902.1 Uncharacterised protein [Yersinia kristensenii]
MAAINTVTTEVVRARGLTDESVTESLDQLVKKKYKDAKQSIKKNIGEMPVSSDWQHKPMMPEVVTRQSAAYIRALNLDDTGNQTQEVTPLKGECTGPHPVNGQSAKEVVSQIGLNIASNNATPTLKTLPPAAATHLVGTSGDRNAESLSWVDALVRKQSEESHHSDDNKLGLTFTTGEQGRMFLGDKAARGGKNTQMNTLLPSQRSDVMVSKMMNSTPAEAVSGSKLTYRFADWGAGHQVSVQLGALHNGPHIMQASDTLVHQRLVDYDGQPHGDAQWVFSDEQEQPNNPRQHQKPDEET